MTLTPQEVAALEQLVNPNGAKPLEVGRVIAGDEFIAQGEESVPAVWGDEDRIAWAAGEPLLIAAPPGVGKTTLAGQLVMSRIGAGPDRLLGLPVTPDTSRRTLYIAADRPRQIARSIRRTYQPAWAEQVHRLLAVHRGPLPFLIDEEPDRLVELARELSAGTIVLDSLKDLAGDLADGKVASRVNRALQLVVAEGIEVVALHHQRKAQEGNKKPRALADLYGSVWITAGAGSVLVLWGDAGDAIVELLHLKQPVADIGPLTLIHDHDLGRTSLLDAVDVDELIAAAEDVGVTVAEVAQRLFATSDPDRNQIEKARRRLTRLEKTEAVERLRGENGLADRYVRVTPRDPSRDPLTPKLTAVTNPDEHGSRTDHTGSRAVGHAPEPPLKGGVGRDRDPNGAAA